MTERCDFSDLPKDQCGHCHPERLPQPHIPQVVRDKMGPGKPRFGPWVIARFDSECDGPCGGQIDEGDQIRSDGEGGWLCADCGSQ
jgi:hypothetical protein